MENTALLQLLLQLDENRMPKSIDFAIDYLLSGRPEALYADCSVSRLGSRVAQAVVRCWQSDASQPIAIARGHFMRSEEHTSELQSLMRISYAVFCLKKKKKIYI